MAANIINATTSGISTVGGDEPILKFQTDGIDRVVMQGSQSISMNFPFLENSTVVSSNYEISADKNAFSAGPIKIADNVVVKVTNGESWTIV